MIAPAAKEARFRAYEKHLASYASNYPAPLIVDERPKRATTTAARRLREAILWYREEAYPSEHIVHADFEAKWRLSEIKMLPDGTLSLQPKYLARLGDEPEENAFSLGEAPASVREAGPWTEEQIDALCTLILAGRLEGPIELEGVELTAELRQAFNDQEIEIVGEEPLWIG